ncbi:40S ribosomal protein S10b-like [Anopheles darlingi]|uniref:40S ribosomal protein S10b-like n=1 Tax=Anopheles darlingi TaxID=43151 RepID=UPI0021005806|nr:40S ribosomal protein S10b-like [Anopheles darlingi]
MFMPKAHRDAIYKHLFKEGVLVAEKDLHAPKHLELDTIPNLHVIKTMQSLKSKNFVKEQLVWCHYYWYLTNEGIEYLRAYLHLQSEIVPSTLMCAARAAGSLRAQGPRPGGPNEGRSEDRQAYRRTQQANPGDKKGHAGAGADDLEFRGGFGRDKRM